MAAPGAQDDNQWRSQTFRQKVVRQIDDALQQTGAQMQKSSVEMEHYVYQKARSRDEYLALVAKVILHMRDLNAKRQGGGSSGGQGLMPGAGPPGMPAQSSMVANAISQSTDPINALQSLTRQSLGPGGTAQAQVAGPGGGITMTRPFQTYQPGMPSQQGQTRMPLQSHGSPMPAAGISSNMQAPPMGSVGPGSNQPTSVLSPSPSVQLSSPAAMIPSPSPVNTIVPSPVARQQASIPSPSSTLNTPSSQSAEDQAYLEKLKQLSVYIEPVRRWIQKYEKDPERKKDLAKFRGLLDILTDSNKRLHLTKLLKCEEALEKYGFGISPKKSGSTVTTALTTTSATTTLVSSIKGAEQQHMCQPLLDAIVAHIKSPLLNHTLKRTFGPVVEALHGTIPRPQSPPAKKPHLEEDGSDIPDLLQAEITRLGQRFRVQLDPLKLPGSKDVHLICSIDDKNLPAVPPISVTVPSNYPDASPICCTDQAQDESTPFLHLVQKELSEKLLKLPNCFSITALLDMWEMSIRRACAQDIL